MKETTRRRKEGLMLKAAARVMQKKGLTNFTMEEVAEEAYVTKVTLYTYFTSKENLTMAVCHRIYKELHQRLLEVEESVKNNKGIDACIKVKSTILNFISEEPFRAKMILEFISIYNMPNDKLSDAMASSPYRIELNSETLKIADILNQQLEKGREDGSILNKNDSDTIFLYMWNCMSGFITLASTPGFQEEKSQEFLQSLANFHENAARHILCSRIEI